ncbi:hypothetical protein UF75_4018 [Desulfosporosinus sp. I2]|uniref:calcium-binding protein n=1 Tax=Desulfosporosinus sp. I2 TaxID=1617025 RepID=UPI0005ED62BB|nr:calcium-binding protein [Desulfosporosinus sp. I2]KJR45583.1 hypothetical protein UF75_4018 [Desulfosporosinus sp. I2]
MFEVIKSEYGKELGVFEFDYLGEHSSLDAVLINAKIKLYEKGLHISTGSSSESLFVEWGCIKGITCTKSRQALINLKTDEGVMKLKKEKKETDISQYKRMLKTHVPGFEIEYVKASPDNLRSIEMKRAEKLYEEQERRVDEFVRNCGGEDNLEIEEAWQKYLENHLQFPFEAEIIDDPGPLKVGDIIKVTAIEGVFGLYGIVVKARRGRKQYSFPICLLEPVEKESNNYQLVDDYNFWFCNR